MRLAGARSASAIAMRHVGHRASARSAAEMHSPQNVWPQGDWTGVSKGHAQMAHSRLAFTGSTYSWAAADMPNPRNQAQSDGISGISHRSGIT